MLAKLFKGLLVGLTLLIGWMGLPAWAQGAATAQFLSAREFKSILDRSPLGPDLVLLDIRTPREFTDGHIEGAVNIDYYNQNFIPRLKTLDRHKTYLIYCRSGNRTAKSLAIFKKLGFTRVSHLESGLVGWVRERFPLVRPSG
jgi:rhodanese-related sulfurtransferase